MQSLCKTALLASALSMSLAGLAAAQSAAPGTSAPNSGPDRSAEAAPLVVETPAGIETELAGKSDGGPGPMGGWPVYSTDGIQLGQVIFSEFDDDGTLDLILFEMADGRQVQVNAAGVDRTGAERLGIHAPAAQIEMMADAPVTAINIAPPAMPAVMQDTPATDEG